MAYAIQIIENSLKRTKELFFPIRPGYWMKMGIVSIFTGSGGGGGNSNFNSSSGDNIDGLTRASIQKFNTEALNFLAQYGNIILAGFALLYGVGLLFSYLASVLDFVFIEGIIKKDVRIRKGFSDNMGIGGSLFFLRLVVGLISLAVTVLILWPAISAFMANRLADMSILGLIPMAFAFVLFAIVMGIFWFIVEDFMVPIMYMKRFTVGGAWNHFRKIAGNKKGEVFLYWLFKLLLGIAAGILTLIVLIPVILIALLFIAIGVGIYFAANAVAGELGAIILTLIYAVIVGGLFLFGIVVLLVPVKAFFTVYSLEMLGMLEKPALPKKPSP